jgi:hypothetical protein
LRVSSARMKLLSDGSCRGVGGVGQLELKWQSLHLVDGAPPAHAGTKAGCCVAPPLPHPTTTTTPTPCHFCRCAHLKAALLTVRPEVLGDFGAGGCLLAHPGSQLGRQPGAGKGRDGEPEQEWLWVW